MGLCLSCELYLNLKKTNSLIFLIFLCFSLFLVEASNKTFLINSTELPLQD